MITIESNRCNCHVETCNCWGYYVHVAGKRTNLGSDSKEKLEETIKAIKEEPNE